MIDKPSAEQLLAKVEQALRSGIIIGSPQRDASNAIALARREFARKAKSEANEHDRLKLLLGYEASIETLNADLCTAIRIHSIGCDNRKLVEHLFETTREKMLIDQPGYPPFSGDL